MSTDTFTPFDPCAVSAEHATAIIKARYGKHGWAADPAGWVAGRLGEHLWSAQRLIAESVRDYRYTAVQSCHGAGKSFVASRLAAWWLDTRDDAFVVTTAPTFPQVRAILWREIGRAHRRGGLSGRVNQTEWWDGSELVGYGRKPADYDQAAFQGIHARHVLVIIDEACGVPKALFDAVDSLATNEHARVLAIGNPDDPTAHFATICRAESGWHVIHVDGLATPNFTGEPVPEPLRPLLPSPEWVEERRQRWGEGSPLWQAKVRGLFPEQADDGLIPLSWVLAAQRRWAEWDEQGRPTQLGRRVVSCDVARFGDDDTVIAIRQGQVVESLHRWHGLDTMAVTGHVIAKLAGQQTALAVVDVIGMGAGPVDRLREQGKSVVGFNASHASPRRDRSGELGFVNTRSAAWWNLREQLDPAYGATLALPPDDQMAADLTAPHWRVTSTGRVQVESKDAIRKRLGRSTDAGDAVVQAVWLPANPVDQDVTGVHPYQTSPDGEGVYRWA